MIRNLVFDMGNVLLNYDPERYLQTITKDRKAAGAILRELFGGPEWIRLDEGTITEAETVTRVQARIPQYAELVAKAMDCWQAGLFPIDGMAALIRRLKDRGYPLYLLSNTSLRFYRYYRNVEVFRYFDGFLISAKEKLIKPDPAIFRRFCERFGVPAGECLFIDDRQDNCDSAAGVGFLCHRFSGPAELETFLTGNGIL